MSMTIFVDAVAAELQRQPWYLRYKASILLTLTTTVWLLTTLAPAWDSAPGWIGPLVASVVSAASILANRLTRDGVTPSMGRRLEVAAERVSQAQSPAPLPVYDAPQGGGVDAN